jgi:hypothetical protein
MTESTEGSAESATLPTLTAKWMTELLGGAIPSETNATCSDCAMCQGSERAVTVQAKMFQPDVKCCSFMPHLPNFSVGGILADNSPEAARGRASVELRIDNQIGVTPFGIDATPVYNVLYANGKVDGFGLSRTLRCPHYIDESGGLCGIWRYRNSVCSTYYCKFVRGAIGQHFWNRLHQLLAAVEAGLERWCAAMRDIGDEALENLVKADFGMKRDGTRLRAAALDGVQDPKAYRQIWGSKWVNCEREFYIATLRLVEPLSWADVVTICGEQVRLYAHLTRRAYDRLWSHDIPLQLRPGQYTATVAQRGFVALQSYSSNDQIVVAQSILDALTLFDGLRSTANVLTAAKSSGLALTPWLVRRLVDFAVLVPSAIS